MFYQCTKGAYCSFFPFPFLFFFHRVNCLQMAGDARLEVKGVLLAER